MSRPKTIGVKDAPPDNKVLKFNEDKRFQFLRLLLSGIRRQEAARKVGFSPKTIVNHRRADSIFDIACDRAEAIGGFSASVERAEKRDVIKRIKAHSRRSKFKDNPFTLDDWIALCDKYGNMCLRCKEVKPLAMDHVVPLSRGGTNSIDNIQPLCRECNSIKHDKSTDYRLDFK